MISRNYDFLPEDQVSEAPGTRRCGIVFTANCLPSLDVTIDPFLPVVSVFFFCVWRPRCGGTSRYPQRLRLRTLWECLVLVS